MRVATSLKESLRLGLWLWPGLAQLWHRGSFIGLSCAVLFVLLLNLALITSFVWPNMIDHTVQGAVWSTVALFWVAGVWTSRRWHAKWKAEGRDEAREEYSRQSGPPYAVPGQSPAPIAVLIGEDGALAEAQKAMDPAALAHEYIQKVASTSPDDAGWHGG